MRDERDTDPEIPVHTPAELAAEETFRDELDDVNDANPWIRWSALVAGVLFLAGAVVRSCW